MTAISYPSSSAPSSGKVLKPNTQKAPKNTPWPTNNSRVIRTEPRNFHKALDSPVETDKCRQ